ncbi:hypothetical protein ACFL6S_31495 [Candidatus Poribacteria bacterium]
MKGWVGENLICEAKRAIRFDAGMPPYIDPKTDYRVPLRIVFRRLYFDGFAVGKYELGLAIPRGTDFSMHQTEELFNHIFQIPITIPNPLGEPKHSQLWKAGKDLAELYLLSSFHTTEMQRETEKFWVQNCSPLIMLVYNKDHDNIRFPFWGKSLELAATDLGDEINLSHHIIPYGGQRIRMWTIREQRNGSARKLRIFLLRLYAEKECLKRILRNIETQKIQISPRSGNSDLLQEYLNTATRRINRFEANSDKLFEEAEIGELARQVEEAISPGESDALLTVLQKIDVRKNVYNKIETFLNQRIPGSTTQVIFMEGGTMINEGDEIRIRESQVGAVGRGAHAHHMSFSQIWQQAGQEIDLVKLAGELSTLREAMLEEADSPEHYAALGDIAKAETAAKEDEGPTVLEHLKSAGKWALGIATKIGTEVAKTALEAVLG